MLEVRQRLAADDLPQRLTRLGFRADDRSAALAAAAAILDRPAEVAVVQSTAERLLPGIGEFFGWDDPRPSPWRSEGTKSAYGAGVLELLALVATVDEVRDFHTARGIGADDSWRALSDLGQQVFVHRLTYGTFGLHTHDWLRVPWSGALYWLGRLQFNLQPDAQASSGWALSTHIPRSGPLTPDAVDASFASARAFFADHFGDYPVDAFSCSSWLLDPQLAVRLPETSNIAAFQRRWQRDEASWDGDADALFFVFARRPPVELTTLPRDTTLQRAILDRLLGGGHWHVRQGWIRFADLDVSR